MTTEVMTKQASAVASYDYGQFAGTGFEGTKPTDLAVPFLAILQSNSPQVEEQSPKGATAGQLINTVTQSLIPGDAGVVFLPVHMDEAFVEWVPRNKGGGLVSMHAPDSDVVRKAVEANGGSRVGKLRYGDNDLVETHYVYGLILNDNGSDVESFAVIAFKSTGIKPYRQFVTNMYTLKGRPPIFANRVRIKTIKQKNEKGSFFNFDINPLRESYRASLINPVQESSLLEAAVSFREQVVNGIARADFSQERTVGDPTAATDPENAPF